MDLTGIGSAVAAVTTAGALVITALASMRTKRVTEDEEDDRELGQLRRWRRAVLRWANIVTEKAIESKLDLPDPPDLEDFKEVKKRKSE